MSTAAITKIRLPALDHVPRGVPSDIQMAIAHPDGFPMIADASGIPIRAVGHFLRLECASPKTALAYRDDIYEFMAGIEAQGRRWNDPALIDDDFRAYRNMLCATPGATGRKRSVETIKRRLAGLKSFYAFAFRKGYVLREFDWDSINSLPRHLLQDEAEQDARALQGREATYIPADHMVRILDLLGPTTAATPSGANRPYRDRLCSETSFESGMRVDEATHLLTRQIPILPGFDPEASLDEEFYAKARRHPKLPIKITWTKRLRARTILLPYDLVWWLNWYRHVERANVLSTALDRLGRDEYQRRGLHQQNWLFLNGTDSPDAYMANRFTAAMASRNFTAAVVEAGYVDDLGDALYTYHAQRGTFGILHYIARLKRLMRQRIPEAEERAIEWVQALLGHKDKETTRRHYVSISRLIEARLGDDVEAVITGRLRSFQA